MQNESLTHEEAIIEKQNQFEALTARLPDRYKDSLERTLAITEEVGLGLRSRVIPIVDLPRNEPGVYVINDANNEQMEKYHSILEAKFELEPEIVSGRFDSAHVLLPGWLSFLRRMNNGNIIEQGMCVAAKGFYKRDMEDRFNRVETEVTTSITQQKLGELAFRPIAVVVAPKYNAKESESSEYDILLVTALDRDATSLDNSPWKLGLSEDNVRQANAAVDALARFNTSVGKHGDAKLKNVAQYPTGQTSMIDFETFEEVDYNNSSEILNVIHTDLSEIFNSLVNLGMFDQEPEKAREVLEQLAERYIETWHEYPEKTQDALYTTVVRIVDRTIDQLTNTPYANAA